MNEKALIEAKREGFAHGRCCYAHELDLDEQEKPCDQCVARAKKVYPIRVSRPRVVKDELDMHWRVSGGYLQWLDGLGEWRRSQDYQMPVITPTRVQVWADLVRTPTELVDAE